METNSGGIEFAISYHVSQSAFDQGVIQFGTNGKLALRYFKPIRNLGWMGVVANKLALPLSLLGCLVDEKEAHALGNMLSALLECTTHDTCFQ